LQTKPRARKIRDTLLAQPAKDAENTNTRNDGRRQIVSKSRSSSVNDAVERIHAAVFFKTYAQPGEREYKRILATFKPTGNSLSARLIEACSLPLAYDAPTHVYFIRQGELVKIGVSKKVPTRQTQLSDSGRIETELLGSVPAGYPSERACHMVLADLRERGEWFRLTDELAQAIKEVCEALAQR